MHLPVSPDRKAGRESEELIVTDSKTYTVRGAEVIVTASVYPRTVDVHITVDLSPLDQDEPDHSPNQIINYIQLPHYQTGQEYWWCKLHRKVTVRTGAQAARVIKHALALVDDAIAQAVIDRQGRKQHLVDALRGGGMKERVRVIFPDRTAKNWFLSSESSQSSYGKPVLVDEQNNPYGPADLPAGTIIRVQTRHILAAEGARAAGYAVES